MGIDEAIAQILKAGTTGVVITGVILILRQVERMRGGSNGNGNGATVNGRNSDFWKAEFRHACREAMTPMMQVISESMRDQKETNLKTLEKMTDMSAGIQELVDMNRRGRSST